MIHRKTTTWREQTRGQTMVEMALVLPIFLLIVLGLFDVGRAVWNYNTIAESARAAARVAAVESNWVGQTGADCTAPTCPADAAELRDHVVAAANSVVGLGVLSDSDIAIGCGPEGGPMTSDCTANNESGNVVTVEVSFTFTPVLALFDIPMSSSATFTIN